jgi:hypothetical protein
VLALPDDAEPRLLQRPHGIEVVDPRYLRHG